MNTDQERTIHALALRHGSVRTEDTSEEDWPERMRPVIRVLGDEVIYLVFEDGSAAWVVASRDRWESGSASAQEIQDLVYE